MYYFAYCANIDPQIMKRHGIKYQTRQHILLYKYKVIFSIKGIPYIEPYFSNIIFTENPNDYVCVILYKLCLYDIQK